MEALSCRGLSPSVDPHQRVLPFQPYRRIEGRLRDVAALDIAAKPAPIRDDTSMQVPLQITLRNIPASPALTEKIRSRVSKLEARGRRIVSCAVTVDAPHKHVQQGREFTVRIDLRVPGREIAVTRSHHEDVYIALREAFDVAARQTEEQTEIVRGHVKTHGAERGIG